MADAQTFTALRMLLDAIVDAVKVAGTMGAPGGVLYAALMDKMTADQFQQVMDLLCAMGRLRRSGHLYFVTA